jgi:uncharacterized protein (DUF1800 family)
MLKPLALDRWNYEAAAHLVNRAGFGGPPAELERIAALSPQEAVAQFVDYERIADTTAAPDWAKPDPERGERYRAARQASPEERRKLLQAEQQTQRQHTLELRGWWLRRMAAGPRPLQEKLTLFWHGHFATSVEKVREAYLMWRQNELFRQKGNGNWLELLVAAGKDPAMLIWLDQAQSRRQHPNENFAREVMELFTLGEGHYTEKDVTEAARALTGWSYDRLTQNFVERPFLHDSGSKTLFGKTGDFKGEDVLGMIVEQPQAARFITAKLWNFFAGEAPSEELVTALAEVFRRGGNEFKPLLRTMFLSEEFYAPSVVRTQVKSPVQWLVGSVRVLERELPPPLVCFGLTRTLGQDLFAPPNVKGWDGGVSWITTNTLLSRYNEAATLVQGDLSSMAGMGMGQKAKQNPAMERRLQNARIKGADVAKLFTEKEQTDKEALIAALEKRLLQAKLKPKQAQVLRDYLDAQGELNYGHILNAMRLVMSTPEYQLT